MWLLYLLRKEMHFGYQYESVLSMAAMGKLKKLAKKI